MSEKEGYASGAKSFRGQDPTVNCIANRFRDRHSALIQCSVGMAPVCHPCTRSGGRLAIAFKFAKGRRKNNFTDSVESYSSIAEGFWQG